MDRAMMDNGHRARVSRSGSRMMHGGFTTVTPLTRAERTAVEAIIDTLIPAEDGWPAVAELGVADLLTGYLVPADAPVSLYPHFGREEFGELAVRIGTPLTGLPIAQRVGSLQAVERAEPALFTRLRDFVYYVYYGHPAVVELLRSSTTYGGDYLGGSQPEGYLRSLETWGDRTFTTRGVFIPSDAVTRAPHAREHA